MRHVGLDEDTRQAECWFAIHEVYFQSANVNDLTVSPADVSYKK